MSLLKNDNYDLHTDMTIAVFPDDARIPTTVSGNYGTVEYIQLNNRRIGTTPASLWYPGGGDTILIKCELDENASGTIFGTVYNNNGIQLIIENKTIKWMRNGTLMKSVGWSKGVHIMGWVSDSNTVSKPYYDRVVDTDVSLGMSHHSVGGCMCALATLSGTTTSYSSYLTSTGAWAIRLYEVLAFSYKENVDENMDKRWYHLYAATNLSATEYGMFETRTMLSFVGNTPTNQGSASVGDRYKYGVQLFDLKNAFGSKYINLLAIMCEPGTLGGIDTDAGWTPSTVDVPSLVTSGEQVRTFIFYHGTSSDHIPMPSGWTPSYAGPNSYEKGELIRGRKPLWSIWNDAIKFGKYAETQQSGLQKMKFNIFRRNNGDLISKVKLEDFEGYNTAKNYPPSFEWDGKVISEFHNGVLCTLDRSHAVVEGSDEAAVFYMNRAIQGDIGIVKLGNLPLWNYSISEQAVAGIDKLSSIGGGLRLDIFDYGTHTGWSMMGSIFKTSADTQDLLDGLPKLLSSDSSETTKNLFKYNGIDCTGYFKEDKVQQYIRWKVLSRGSRRVKATLILLTDVVQSMDTLRYIDCECLVPSREGSIVANFNPKLWPKSNLTNTLENDRLVIGEQDGIANIGASKYIIAVQSSYIRAYQNMQVASYTTQPVPHGYSLSIGCSLKANNSNTYLKMFGTGATPVFGYAEVVEEKTSVTDLTDDIVITQIPDEEEFGTYNVYTLLATRNFTSCDVVSADDEVIRTDNIDGSVTFNIDHVLPQAYGVEYNGLIRCYLIDIQGKQECLEFKYTNTSVSYEEIHCRVEITFSNPDDSHSQIQLISRMYPDQQSATASRIGGYKIQNRLYGFTKAVKNVTLYGEQTNKEYLYPLWSGSPMQEFHSNSVYGKTYENGTAIPFSGGPDRENGEMGAFMFMWHDMYGAEVIGAQRPTNPFTAHVRLFGVGTSVSNYGPHAWDLYGSLISGSERRRFDGIYSENPYLYVSAAQKIYMFHNHDRLIQQSDDGNYTFVDAYLSVWNSNGPITTETDLRDTDQVTNSDAWVGRTIIIYKGDLHEPKDGVQTKSELCRTTVLTATDISAGFVITSGNFRVNITSNVVYHDYACFPLRAGGPEYESTGLFHITVEAHTSKVLPTPGTMYYIDII